MSDSHQSFAGERKKADLLCPRLWRFCKLDEERYWIRRKMLISSWMRPFCTSLANSSRVLDRECCNMTDVASSRSEDELRISPVNRQSPSCLAPSTLRYDDRWIAIKRDSFLDWGWLVRELSPQLLINAISLSSPAMKGKESRQSGSLRCVRGQKWRERERRSLRYSKHQDPKSASKLFKSRLKHRLKGKASRSRNEIECLLRTRIQRRFASFPALLSNPLLELIDERSLFKLRNKVRHFSRSEMESKIQP